MVKAQKEAVQRFYILAFYSCYLHVDGAAVNSNILHCIRGFHACQGKAAAVLVLDFRFHFFSGKLRRHPGRILLPQLKLACQQDFSVLEPDPHLAPKPHASKNHPVPVLKRAEGWFPVQKRHDAFLRPPVGQMGGKLSCKILLREFMDVNFPIFRCVRDEKGIDIKPRPMLDFQDDRQFLFPVPIEISLQDVRQAQVRGQIWVGKLRVISFVLKQHGLEIAFPIEPVSPFSPDAPGR